MTLPLIVQDVMDVALAEKPLNESSPKEAIELLIGASVEACSEYFGRVVSCRFHPFVCAVHAAFTDHRPLILSPDMFWLLIAQGLAAHINENAEDYRSQFVNHEDKAKIIVRKDEFIKGSPENPWADVFDEFSQQIKRHIGERNHANIVVNFSTTGPIEKAANEIVLMDAMQNYFEYRMNTMCGIPQVILEGHLKDWATLRDHTKTIGDEYGLEWWTSRLVPILDSIVKNVAGADDPELWSNIYKWQLVSGGDSISGWIADFFPYLACRGETRRNWTFDQDLQNRGTWHGGIGTSNLPGSLSKAPFIWEYYGKEFSMEFIAGFTSFTQNPESMAVRPKIGWAVREAKNCENEDRLGRSEDSQTCNTPRIVIVDSSNAGESIELTGDCVILGRAPNADITFELSVVSRSHAQLVRDQLGYAIEDLDSRNGTRVNGTDCRGRVSLKDGDRIQLGPIDIIYRCK